MKLYACLHGSLHTSATVRATVCRLIVKLYICLQGSVHRQGTCGTVCGTVCRLFVELYLELMYACREVYIDRQPVELGRLESLPSGAHHKQQKSRALRYSKY